MTKLVAIYVDALGSDHIDPEITPNLYQWQQDNYISELSNLFAFKGISAAMYGGIPPSESGVWMDFKVRTEPIDKLGDTLLSAAPRIPDGLPRKAYVTLYERLIRRAQVTPHIIPPDLRPYFEPHPDKSMRGSYPLDSTPTIFDVFREDDISYRTIGLSGGPQERIKKKISNVNKYEEDVVIFKITQLDHIGHKFGPGSKNHSESLKEVDSILGTVQRKAEANGYRTFYYSDHGMQSVTDSINLRSILISDIGLEEKKDFIAFFNSTCMLIRWLSPEARSLALSKFEDIDQIIHINQTMLNELWIGETGEKFADDIIATKPGVTISPDFYRRSPPAGMHGFIDNQEGGPVAITPGNSIQPNGRLWDMPSTIMELISKQPRDQWSGNSLLI